MMIFFIICESLIKDYQIKNLFSTICGDQFHLALSFNTGAAVAGKEHKAMSYLK